MTPQERRAKHPIHDAWLPLSELELATLRHATQEWIDRPPFHSRVLDITYTRASRLIATIDALMKGAPAAHEVATGAQHSSDGGNLKEVPPMVHDQATGTQAGKVAR